MESTSTISTDVQESFALVHQLEEELSVYITDPQRKFLTAYAETLNLRAAARLTGFDRNIHYQALRRSKDYAAIFKILEQDAIRAKMDDWLEEAHEGLIKLKFDKNGDPIIDPRTGQPYEEKQIDTIMRIFLMKAKGGYSDNGPHSRQGSSGPVINVIMPGNSQPPTIQVEFDSENDAADLDS